jgi:hypothetical protein
VQDGPRQVPSPSGAAPPIDAVFPGGAVVRLPPLAEAVSTAFFERFPEELDRYGEAGRDWCRHDNQYLVAWAAHEASAEDGTLAYNVDWLCRVLGARDYPLERLADALRIAADVVSPLAGGDAVAAHLVEAAGRVTA